MPRWVNNPKDVPLNKIYNVGDYELKALEFSPFANSPKEDGSQSWGVQCKFEFLDGEYKGEKYATRTYLHNGNSEQFTKQMQMALAGFPATADGELAFNDWAADKDWMVDTDAQHIGQAWKDFTGKVVSASFDIKPNKQNNTPQNQVKWSAIV